MSSSSSYISPDHRDLVYIAREEIFEKVDLVDEFATISQHQSEIGSDPADQPSKKGDFEAILSKNGITPQTNYATFNSKTENEIQKNNRCCNLL